jgi:hypothetical protein
VSEVICDLRLVIGNSQKNISRSQTNEHNHIPELIYYVFTAAGWILFGFGVIQFPIWALIAVIKRRKVSNVLHSS